MTTFVMILIYAAGVLGLITTVGAVFIVLAQLTVSNTYDPDAEAH